jgi:hypothetical protein
MQDAVAHGVDPSLREVPLVQLLHGEARPDVRRRRRGEDTLVTDVVDREDAARIAEDALVPGIGSAQQQRCEGRVPVIAVHDVRREPHALAAVERGAGQHQVAHVLIGRVRVDSRPVEDRRAVDQVDPEVRARLARSVDVVMVRPYTDLHGEALQVLDRSTVDALQVHLPVQRHEHAYVMAALSEIARQGSGHVAEAARLRKRRDFGGQEAHAQRHGASLPQAASRSRAVP